MSLPHALLTALIEHPGSGLELASRFDRSIGYFWQATHQQIYRELGRLEVAGWVKSEPVEQSRGKKKTYRVLPAGRKELKRWIQERVDTEPIRREMLVRLRAEAAVGPTNLQAAFKDFIALREEKLAFYRRIQARDFSGNLDSRQRQLHHLVLKAGIAHETMWLDVAREASQILSSPQD